MLKLVFSNKFKKDFKRMLSRGCKEEHFDEVVKMLVRGISLPENIKSTIYVETTKILKNVILNQIGS